MTDPAGVRIFSLAWIAPVLVGVACANGTTSTKSGTDFSAVPHGEDCSCPNGCWAPGDPCDGCCCPVSLSMFSTSGSCPSAEQGSTSSGGGGPIDAPGEIDSGAVSDAPEASARD
jgi:hypothetical protein